MNSGTQAIDGMARSACRVGSIRRRTSARIAGDGADHRAGGHADAEAGGDPPQRRQRMALQFAGARQIDERREDDRGRRHQPAGGPAHPHDDFPGHREHDRQRQAERRPQRSATSVARSSAPPGRLRFGDAFAAQCFAAAMRHGHRRHAARPQNQCGGRPPPSTKRRRSGRRSDRRPSASRRHWPGSRRPAARRGRLAGSSRAAARRSCD